MCLSIPAPAHGQTVPCDKTVTFGLIEAKTDANGCLNRVGLDEWESDDTVRVNGVSLPPLQGTKLVLHGPSAAHPGGTLGVHTRIVVRGAVLYDGPLNVDLPQGGLGDEKTLKSFKTDGPQEILGLEIGGSVTLRLGYDDDGHYAVFRVVLELPAIFQAGPGEGEDGGLTGSLGLRVDEAGEHVNAAKIEVKHAYIGQLGLEGLCLSFIGAGQTADPCDPPALGAGPVFTCESNANQDRWDGSATIVLPTASETEISVWAGLGGGALRYAGAAVSNLGNNVPIASGVFLNSIGLAICAGPPLKLAGSAGVSFGPEIGGHSAAVITGTLLYENSRPWRIDADGSLDLFDQQVAQSHLGYRSTGAIDFSFGANFTFASSTKVMAGVAGFYDPGPPRRFNVEGNGSICVPSCTSGEALISTKGAAGCVTLSGIPIWVLVKDSNWKWHKPWRVHWEMRTISIRAGAGYLWATKQLSLMGNSCDMGPYRVMRRRRAVASAGDGDRLTVRVRGGQATVFRLVGRDAPPQVRLTGPGGRTITSPQGGANTRTAIEKGSHILAEDAATNTTAVAVAQPAAGTWTATALEGSSAIANLDLASPILPPTVVAGVGRRPRGRRVLGYCYDAHPGRSILFVERGPETTKVLGAATGTPSPSTVVPPADRGHPRCGRIRFTPGPGLGGKRRVYAYVQDADDVTIRVSRVATFRAPDQPLPGRATFLRLRRRPAGEVAVRWGDAAHVHHWDVVAEMGDGRRILEVVPAGTQHTVIADVNRRTRIKVTVGGIRYDNGDGPPIAAKLRRLRNSVRVPPD